MSCPSGWVDLGDAGHPEHYARTQPSADAVPSIRLVVMGCPDGSWTVTDCEWPARWRHRTRAAALEAADVRLREVPNGLTRADFVSVFNGEHVISGLPRERLRLALAVGRAMWVDQSTRASHARKVRLLERTLGLAPVQGELFAGGV